MVCSVCALDCIREEGKCETIILKFCVGLPTIAWVEELVAIVEPSRCNAFTNGEINTENEEIVTNYTIVGIPPRQNIFHT